MVCTYDKSFCTRGKFLVRASHHTWPIKNSKLWPATKPSGCLHFGSLKFELNMEERNWGWMSQFRELGHVLLLKPVPICIDRERGGPAHTRCFMGCHSNWCSLLSFLTIYMKPLGEAIHHLRMRHHQYPDDTKLSISFLGEASDAVGILWGAWRLWEPGWGTTDLS